MFAVQGVPAERCAAGPSTGCPRRRSAREEQPSQRGPRRDAPRPGLVCPEGAQRRPAVTAAPTAAAGVWAGVARLRCRQVVTEVRFDVASAGIAAELRIEEGADVLGSPPALILVPGAADLGIHTAPHSTKELDIVIAWRSSERAPSSKC
jgi:hypothetical protein